MGEVVDSKFVSKIDVTSYGRRTKEYLDVLSPSVDVWEIGNEVNGEWLGSTPDVVAKISAAYELVKQRKKPTALTLYYNEGCWLRADHEMFAWADRNVPAAMKDGLDYVLVSYHEDDCHGSKPDWAAVFHHLAAMFPTSELGFGECGTVRADAKENSLADYYRTRPAEDRFVGGYFWWYFSQDMVPRSKPLWKVLYQVMMSPG